MKLLASLTSPYARKIRIVLAEKALPFELVVDSPWEANTRIPEVNPLGKVPVLVADSGETFFDSPVIAGSLDTLGAPPALLPGDALDAVRVRQTEALADGVTDAAVTALLESRRPDGERSAREIARQRDKIDRGLAELERRLDDRHWFNGGAMMLGGVVQMLSPQPAGLARKESADNKASYAFGGVTNTASQGYPVPLLYGKRRIGGAIISAGIYVEDQQ